MFGSTGGGGSLFGGAQPTPGAGAFGSGAAGSSGFGGSSFPASGGFGSGAAPTGTGGAFGASGGPSGFGGGGSNTMFGGAAGGTSSSLFGGGSGGGGGGFGTTTPASGSSLFGPPAGASSGFGGTSAGGMFGGGAGTANPTGAFGSSGGGMFGGGTNPSTSLFGGGNAFGASGTAGGGGLFGKPSTGGLGGSANGGLFGGGTTGFGGGGGNTGFSAAPVNAFGAPSTGYGGGAFGTMGGGFGAGQGGYGHPTIGMQQRLDRQTEHVMNAEAPGIPWWYRELTRVQAAYRVCQYSKFQTMMYEVSPTAPDIHGHLHLSMPMVEQAKAERKKQLVAQVPWLENNMREWHLFEERNPDPANWLPCPVIGVDALAARVDAQVKYTEEQLKSVEREKNKDWLESAAADLRLMDQKIESCRRTHSLVSNRLVSVLGRLERLQSRQGPLKGPRTPNEVKFHEKLEKLRKMMDDPKGCKAKLLQIEARLGEILSKRATSDFEEEPGQSTSEIGSDNAKKATEAEDEKRMQQILAFMQEQRQGINTVMEVIRRDARDVKLMREKLANQ